MPAQNSNAKQHNDSAGHNTQPKQASSKYTFSSLRNRPASFMALTISVDTAVALACWLAAAEEPLRPVVESREAAKSTNTLTCNTIVIVGCLLFIVMMVR
jgi:hypothetical protein